jgi:hypothetical protein
MASSTRSASSTSSLPGTSTIAGRPPPAGRSQRTCGAAAPLALRAAGVLAGLRIAVGGRACVAAAVRPRGEPGDTGWASWHAASQAAQRAARLRQVSLSCSDKPSKLTDPPHPPARAQASGRRQGRACTTSRPTTRPWFWMKRLLSTQ